MLRRQLVSLCAHTFHVKLVSSIVRTHIIIIELRCTQTRSIVFSFTDFARYKNVHTYPRHACVDPVGVATPHLHSKYRNVRAPLLLALSHDRRAHGKNVCARGVTNTTTTRVCGAAFCLSVRTPAKQETENILSHSSCAHISATATALCNLYSR